MSECATVTITRSVTSAAGVYAPGHIGELTQYLPFELVDDVLSETKQFSAASAISRPGLGCTSCSRSCSSHDLDTRGCGRNSPQV